MTVSRLRFEVQKAKNFIDKLDKNIEMLEKRS